MSHGQHHDPVQHVNDDHADDLLAAAQAFASHPDATHARAERIDADGIDLLLATPRGETAARVSFTEPVADPAGLAAAFGELTRKARAALAAADGNEPNAS